MEIFTPWHLMIRAGSLLGEAVGPHTIRDNVVMELVKILRCQRK